MEDDQREFLALHRAVVRLETKMDLFLERLQAIEGDFKTEINELEARMIALERHRAWLIGAAAACGAGLGYLPRIISFMTGG